MVVLYYMKFTGLLLKESLQDLDILKLINITKEESWDVDNAADFQPKVWSLNEAQ